MVVAAKAFRLWLRGRPGAVLPESAPVRITDAKCDTTGLGHSVVSTAGDLRGVDAGKSRVVRELLSALIGASSGPEGKSESEPAVCAVEEGRAAEVREGGAPLIEGRSIECGSRDSSTQGVSKRKRPTDEEEDGGCGGGTREEVLEGKKKKRANREGAGVASAARKAEIVGVDLTSVSNKTKKGKKRKKQREGQVKGSSDRGVRHATRVEEDPRERQGAQGGCRSSVEKSTREERRIDAAFETSAEQGASATAPVATVGAEQKPQGARQQDGVCQETLEEGSKKRKSKKSKAKKDSRSGQPIPLFRPMDRANKKGEAVKEGHSVSSKSGSGNSEEGRNKRKSKKSKAKKDSRSGQPIPLVGPMERVIKKRGEAVKERHSGGGKSGGGNGVGQGSGANAKRPLLTQGCETETPRRKPPLTTSTKKRLMDWITNGY